MGLQIQIKLTKTTNLGDSILKGLGFISWKHLNMGWFQIHFLWLNYKPVFWI